MYSRPSIQTTKLGYSAILLLMTALACEPSKPTVAPERSSGPPDSLVGTTGVSEFDVDGLELLASLAMTFRVEQLASGAIRQRADINNRPIHLWFLRDATGGLGGILVAGHAEHQCCAKVSAALNDTRTGTPALDDWNSYGVGSLTSKGEPDHRVALEQLAARLDRLADEPTCSGHVIKHDLQVADVRKFESEIAHKSGRACELSDQTRRPIAARVKVDGIPAFVPLYRRDGTEVHFTLTEVDLQLGTKLKRNLTTDPVARERRELRWMIARLRTLMALIPQIGPSPTRKWASIEVSNVSASGNAALIRAEISTASATIREVADWCKNSSEIVSILDELSAQLEAQCREIEGDADYNDRIRASLPHRGFGQATYRRYSKISSDDNPFYDQLGEYQKALPVLKQQLGQLERHKVSARSDGDLILVDAILRGWPATFTSASMEREYDKWAMAQQSRVWNFALNSLRDFYQFEGTPEDILVSNVYFEVARAPDRSLEVTPHYVHDSDFYIICEPGDSFARYESVTADSNLFSINEGDTP